jgi:hypothetical protein
MKKTLLIVAFVSITVLTLGLAGYAYAQDQTPDYPYGPGMMGSFDGYSPGMMEEYDGYGPGFGHGMMGGRGMMGWNGGEGPMHDTMIASLAEALGLSVDEIEARHDAGETIWEIAEAEGLTAEDIQELMFSTHEVALEDAVANGLLTQEQAEWMDGHMEQMWDGGNHCGEQNGSGFGSHRGGMNW